MERVGIRFYEELNELIPTELRCRPFEFEFELPRSVKDLIESIGVPHVEIDLILVNGHSVGFDWVVADQDRISVYPVFERLYIGPVTRLRPRPLRITRFVADVHLAALARQLRMLGFDVTFDPSANDAKLAEISALQQRVLLTRDRGLVKRGIVTRGLFLLETDPFKQTREVLGRLDLYDRMDPFSRCIRCNGTLRNIEETISPGERLDEIVRRGVPPAVRKWCTSFSRCTGCRQIYWRGSHYEAMQKRIEALLERR